MRTVDIDATTLIPMFDVAVRIRRLWRVRLGLWIIGVGARIAGAALNVTNSGHEPQRI